jgi:hypothetical protein
MGFKKRSGSALSLADKVSKLTEKKAVEKDEAEWKLTVDKSGNGNAVIRFLPHKDEKKLAFVTMINHGYKQNGRWFIENCPTLHGKDCPICEANRELWATEVESNRKIASLRKQKTSYWANILVLKDPANPDAENKVFKYRFGIKILEKIQAHAKGDEALGESEVDIDCVFEGANFSLKAQKKDDYQNYDLSKFGNSTALYNGDQTKLDALFDSLHDIDDIADEKHCKTYEVLAKEFAAFNGAKDSKKIASASESLPSEDDVEGETVSDKEVDELLNVGNADAELDDLEELMAGLD